jgi:ribonuclease P protein component
MPGSARLSRSRRILRRVDFERVTKQSQFRSRDECFTVHAAAREQPHARLGVTVARRVSLKAVARNRIKRQIRESFRQHQHALGCIDIVVIAQPPANAKSNPQLRTSLSDHWKRVAHACKKSPL